METVIVTTERFKEQRRPLSLAPRRSEEILVTEQNDRAQYFWNALFYGKDKVMGVPIWNEAFFPVNATQNDTVITTTASIEKYWNLQNQCDYVMFFNFVTLQYEVKELASATNTTITLAGALNSTFDTTQTVIFPLFLGYVEQLSLDPESFSVHNAKIKFTEL